MAVIWIGCDGATPDVTGGVSLAAEAAALRPRPTDTVRYSTLLAIGTAPLEASSGKTARHRLNRGGDRQANNALYRVVITRMASHPATKVYVARRRAEGKSTGEIVRILKRYVAREAFKHLRPAATT